MRFVLASASPARLATLRAAGVEPEVIVSGVDESSVHGRDTVELVDRLAWRKASGVAAGLTGPAIVLGCDSLLEFDGQSFGKPAGVEDAHDRWRSMRGRTGILHTGHALIDTSAWSADRDGSAGTRRDVASTTVRFANASDEEIDRYCATGEPLAVAGSFTLDGLGGWLVAGVDGDPHNVVGVSLTLLRRMLRDLGLGLVDLGWPADVPH